MSYEDFLDGDHDCPKCPICHRSLVHNFCIRNLMDHRYYSYILHNELYFSGLSISRHIGKNKTYYTTDCTKKYNMDWSDKKTIDHCISDEELKSLMQTIQLLG